MIDTVGLNERTWMSRDALPHTEQLHMIERLTRTDFNTLKYEVTFDDPGAYTAPWTSGYTKTWAPANELFEYVCQQNNYGPELMVGFSKVERPARATSSRKGTAQVRLSDVRATFSGGPDATTRPPSSPAPGPMSMTQSLAGDHAHVVLDDDDGVAGVDQAVELRHQLLDVGGMQAGRRLVEDVERVAALRALQLGRELDALRLAAGELGRRLAEPQVAEADLAQHVERAAHVRLVGEELARRVDGHAQHVGDVLAAVRDLQRLRVVARAVAGRARRVDARQEQQLDHHEAFALAGLAAALGDVEREAPGVVAAGARRLGRGEQLAHVIEQPGVGREVRARRAADRLLIDRAPAA